MALNFNTRGDLHETISLTYEEFVHHFGTNDERTQQITNALPFLRTFHSCGCTTVYVGGSFVSTKKIPGDIDLCFDLSGIDEEKIKKSLPEFFDWSQLGRICRDLKCHILYFNEKTTELLDMLKTDRYDNRKGMVKLDLNDIIYYDQK
ncbi:MAG TPA: hypothetical protein VGM30_15130 [Puia sp.]|jgi:hypothetical protein